MIEGQIRASWEISRKPPPNLQILLCLRLSFLHLVWIPPVCCFQMLMYISPLNGETPSCWQYKSTIKLYLHFYRLYVYLLLQMWSEQRISMTDSVSFILCNGCLLCTWPQYLFIYDPTCLCFASSEVIWPGLCCAQYVGRWMIALKDCVFRGHVRQQVLGCSLTPRRVCAQDVVATACRWPDESV